MSGSSSHPNPQFPGERNSPDCLRPRRVTEGPGDGAVGQTDQNPIMSPAPGSGGRRGLQVQFLSPGGEVGSGTQDSISFTCVPTSRGETSSILKSGRPKWGCRRLWDRLTFRSTCGERFAANPLFLGSNPSTSTPNPRPQLTVQAVFKENLFCLKEMRMRVEEAGQSLSTLGSPINGCCYVTGELHD